MFVKPGNTKKEAYIGVTAKTISIDKTVALIHLESGMVAYFASAAALAELTGYNPTTMRTWAQNQKELETGVKVKYVLNDEI